MQKYSLNCAFLFLATAIVFSLMPRNVHAQSKDSALISLIESKTYSFVVTHESGGDFAIGTYFLSVINDSVSAALPYHGNSGVAAYSMDDNGINVHTRAFSYNETPTKKGGYVIKIKLKNDRLTSDFTLRISKKGYAVLAVDSYNRDAITFDGVINALQ